MTTRISTGDTAKNIQEAKANEPTCVNLITIRDFLKKIYEVAKNTMPFTKSDITSFTHRVVRCIEPLTVCAVIGGAIGGDISKERMIKAAASTGLAVLLTDATFEATQGLGPLCTIPCFLVTLALQYFSLKEVGFIWRK